MKKDTEQQKRLKLEIDTVRRLENDELNNVVGGAEAGDLKISVSISAVVYCKCC